MDLTKERINEIKAISAPEGAFPHRQFEALKRYGCLKAIIPKEYGGRALGLNKGTAQLLKLLKTVGSIDLSLGRLFEGHVNALLLIYDYGSPAQKHKYFREAAHGNLFGVWNTDLHQEPVNLEKTNSGYSLNGKKAFCSGGLCIHRPLITSYSNGSPQLIIIHSEDLDASVEDMESWTPMGMRSSRSTTIDFNGYTFGDAQILGKPGSYLLEPAFSTGAIRFAAIQLGGAETLALSALSHLMALGRHTDAIQNMRIGKIALLLESGRNWIGRTGEIMDNNKFSATDKINYANMVRTAILDICTEVMHLAERAVGLQGMMQPHEIEKLHRDLSTYLKQPAPDFALSRVGEWASLNSDQMNPYNQ